MAPPLVLQRQSARIRSVSTPGGCCFHCRFSPKLIVLVSTWLLILTIIPWSDAATSSSSYRGVPMNVNLDRKSPGGVGMNTPSGSAATQSAGNRKTMFGGVALDLTGQVSCHLVGKSPHHHQGPTHDLSDQRMISPVWTLPRGNKLMPSVRVGSNYDFGRVWFGINRLFCNLQWNTAHHQHKASQRKLPSVPVKRRHKIHLRAEKGVFQQDDYGIELGVETSSHSRTDFTRQSHWAQSFFGMRLDTGPSGGMGLPRATMTLASNALHRRIRLVSQTTGLLGHSTDIRRHQQRNSGYFASRLPLPPSTADDFLPDLRITPSGRMSFHIGIPLSQRARHGSRHRAAVKLVVSRQLDWNVLGLPSPINDFETRIKLELSGLHSGGNALSRVEIETALERIRDAAHVTFTHEHAVPLDQWSLTTNR